MINLLSTGGNQFVVYCDAESQFTDEFFLIGFQNIFSREWLYVHPTILRRNRRFVELSVSLVPEDEEDPFDGSLFMNVSGNYDYKVWNTPDLDLDPATGTLVENGQCQLETEYPEVDFETHVSDNEDADAVVYNPSSAVLAGSNEDFIIYCDATNVFTGAYFLLGLQNVFSGTWFYVVPTVVTRNHRFVELHVDFVEKIAEVPLSGSVYISSNGSYNYGVWNIDTPTLDPTGATVVETGQTQLIIQGSDVMWTNFVSDNEDGTAVVYVSPIPDYCLIWNLSRVWWNKIHVQFGQCSGLVWDTAEPKFDEAQPAWNNA